MTNEELVEQIQAGVDVQKNMGLLYEQNEKSIECLAYRYSCKIERAEKEDLMQEAYLALVQAVSAFDFNKTQVFYPYFELRMKTKFERWCSGAAHVKKIPDYLTRKIIKYSSFNERYIHEHNAEPSDEEVMNALDISQKQLDSLQKTIASADCLSLDEVYADGGDEWITAIAADDAVEDRVITALLQDYCKNILWLCVDSLTARESIILHEIYEENKTYAEIAVLESCTDEAIRIVENKAFNKLKLMDEIKFIACEYSLISYTEYEYESFSKTGFNFFKVNGYSSVENAVINKMSIEKSKVKMKRLLKQMQNGNMSEELFSGINRLKDTYKQLLTLRYIEGHRMKEVAKIMNMNKTYVSGLHTAALNQLNEMLLGQAA